MRVDFKYKFQDINGTTRELCYPLDIPYTEDPKELVHRIVASEMHPVMRYLDHFGKFCFYTIIIMSVFSFFSLKFHYRSRENSQILHR